MKTFRLSLLALVVLLSSCSVWNKAFPPKYGCGTDGKNIGAEKLLDGSDHKKATQVQELTLA